MPLVVVSHLPPAPHVDGLILPMTDGQTRTPVFISTEALQDISSPPMGSLDSYAVNKHRIWEIASKKADLGEIDEDGTLRITTADLKRWP